MRCAAERDLLCATIEKCHRISTAAELNHIMASAVHAFIPHAASMCGIGNVETHEHLICLKFGFLREAMAQMSSTFCLTNNVLFREWTRRRIPQYCDLLELAGDALRDGQRRWRDVLLDHGVTNVAMHGVVDIEGRLATVFYLTQLPKPLTDSQRLTFEILAPHLHHSVVSIARARSADFPRMGTGSRSVLPATLAPSKSSRDECHRPLTLREKEVLRWVYWGKTNSEIAAILRISELTVRSHVYNFMLKLGVRNRTQAVVKAIQYNVIAEVAVSESKQFAHVNAAN